MTLDDIFEGLHFTQHPAPWDHPIRGIPGSINIKTGERLYGCLRPEIRIPGEGRLFRVRQSTYARERGYLVLEVTDDAGLEHYTVAHLDLSEYERFNTYAEQQP